MMEACPIVPDQAVKMIVGGREIILTANMDSIQMFQGRSEANYLRYYDVESKLMKCLHLSENILATLMDYGIPPQKRTTITESEYGLFVDYVASQETSGLDDEIERFFS
jgi:hypothetical protein